MTDLTAPEYACDIARAKAIRDRVVKDGGCAHCRWRAVSWGLVHCGLERPQVFPDCVGKGFAFDDEARVP